MKMNYNKIEIPKDINSFDIINIQRMFLYISKRIEGIIDKCIKASKAGLKPDVIGAIDLFLGAVKKRSDGVYFYTIIYEDSIISKKPTIYVTVYVKKIPDYKMTISIRL